VISCRETVQEAMNRKQFSPMAAKALGEMMACSLLMGSGLKGEETLQVNIVGSSGVKSLVVITDGKLQIKGMIGDAEFNSPASADEALGCYDLVGEGGQVQVVRNHPLWKHSMNGIVALRNADIAMNLALYLAESEQRSAVLLTDVKISADNKCEYALGLLAESLPGLEEKDLEKCIENVTRVQQRKLSSYLELLNQETDPLEAAAALPGSSSTAFLPVGKPPISLRMEEVLHRVLDECYRGLDEAEGPNGRGIRFSKTPRFRCECNESRVLRAVSLLPAQDISEILQEGKDVESNCGFCGKGYRISTAQLSQHLAEEGAASSSTSSSSTPPATGVDDK
jgi:molecular chaperone Hsp33